MKEVDGVIYTVPPAVFDLVPEVLSVLALTVGNDPAEVLLLAAMVVGSVGVTVHLIRRAGRARDRTAALLLACSLVVTFVLAQLLLLVAVVRLVRSTGPLGDGATPTAPLTSARTTV